MDIKNELYYLISESTIKEINSKIVVLNKAAQFMKNEGFESMSESLAAYVAEIRVMINSAYECDVFPRKILESEHITED